MDWLTWPSIVDSVLFISDLSWKQQKNVINIDFLFTDETTNINPLNFNHQLNVANILLQLDDEDIDVIESELTDEELDQLNPALQVKDQIFYWQDLLLSC